MKCNVCKHEIKNQEQATHDGWASFCSKTCEDVFHKQLQNGADCRSCEDITETKKDK
ncbi:MAG: hypothetical protein ACRCRZ_01245 [Metamycoplasmataceae bacterium]